jgi:flagellar FliJ protein
MQQKDLHSLIRLRKWDVDEKQRALAQLLRQEESVLERQDALEAEVRAEMAFTSALPGDQRRTLPAYLKRCDEFRQRLVTLLDEVRRQMATAQAELAEAYRRLKTFEVTQEKRDEAAEKEEARLEQIELNEIGLELHRRKSQPAI